MGTFDSHFTISLFSWLRRLMSVRGAYLLLWDNSAIHRHFQFKSNHVIATHGHIQFSFNHQSFWTIALSDVGVYLLLWDDTVGAR